MDETTAPLTTDVDELHLPAHEIRPGDHLPPQSVLHGTRYQREGFTVGPHDRDVADLPVLSGRVLLFGPSGTLDTVPRDARVAVRRPRGA